MIALVTWFFKWGPFDAENLTLTKLIIWSDRVERLRKAGAE